MNKIKLNKMLDMEENIAEGVKLICEFVDGKGTPVGEHDGLYYSSWDWQVPVFSKLYRKALSELYKDQEAMKQLSIYSHNYLSAIEINSTSAGFEMLIYFLKWYQKQSICQS